MCGPTYIPGHVYRRDLPVSFNPEYAPEHNWIQLSCLFGTSGQRNVPLFCSQRYLTDVKGRCVSCHRIHHRNLVGTCLENSAFMLVTYKVYRLCTDLTKVIESSFSPSPSYLDSEALQHYQLVNLARRLPSCSLQFN